eukprot:TRINITY_DN106158_c0_g1_i1.p1 TRINITY_DN106158_c0_g1~~TRINITY_DN106158_c0_g1_i1.p1  ORF type:complete len:363 (-),score=62.34 TRINITY_DN106158_c0_g1_i1:172-1260(-)
MAFVLRLYARGLEKHFYLTNSIAAGTLYASGDCLAQRLEKMNHVESPGKKHYNYKRTARMWIFGFFAAGPILGIWYSLLHRMTSVFRYQYVAVQSSSSVNWSSSMSGSFRREPLDSVGHRIREGSIKVVLDVLLFQAPFLNLYLLFMSGLEGHSIEDACKRCRRNFHDAWAYSSLFWSPAQFANFMFVPTQYNALTVNFCSMMWLAFLSVLYHKRDYGAAKASISPADVDVETSGHPLDVVDSEGLESIAKAQTASEAASEQLSELAEHLLQILEATAGSAAKHTSTLSMRIASAFAAAKADWNESTDAEWRNHVQSLSELVEEQRRQLGSHEQEAEVLRRTITAQAMRIQVLQEGRCWPWK